MALLVRWPYLNNLFCFCYFDDDDDVHVDDDAHVDDDDDDAQQLQVLYC